MIHSFYCSCRIRRCPTPYFVSITQTHNYTRSQQNASGCVGVGHVVSCRVEGCEFVFCRIRLKISIVITYARRPHCWFSATLDPQSNCRRLVCSECVKNGGAKAEGSSISQYPSRHTYCNDMLTAIKHKIGRFSETRLPFSPAV